MKWLQNGYNRVVEVLGALEVKLRKALIILVPEARIELARAQGSLDLESFAERYKS